jgi:hypothetical protein
LGVFVVFDRGLHGFCFDLSVFNAFCIHRHKPPVKFICRACLQPISDVLSELTSKPTYLLPKPGFTLFLAKDSSDFIDL